MKSLIHLLALIPVCLVAGLAVAAERPADKKAIERGRYLIKVAGCNDCHTPAYMEKSGAVPEKDWLTGSNVGFRGPWGTTYPANLRLVAQSLSESDWVVRARAPMRPPMPWFNLQAMTDTDLRAMYRYIRALGAAGDPAPTYVGPDRSATTPYFDFTPKNLPVAADK